ncbi:MAG: hypothetical protein IJK92_08330 [Bacteroidales bacterium]|nr:hypothetical protein [Bacteroidales bacterium]
MKILKSVAVFFALLLMPSFCVNAQNFDKTRCRDENCVLEILKRLVTDDEAVIAETEKALENLAEDAFYYDVYEIKNALKNSIFAFVEKFEDCKSNAFLVSLLSKLYSANESNEIMKLVENEKLADAAIRAVANIPGTNDIITKYIVKHHDDLRYKAALAYAVGKLNIQSMENELISWLKDADDETKIEIYNALLVVGSNEKTASIVEKGAKKLYKSKIADYKIAGMKLLSATKSEKCLPYLYKALKNNDKRVRVAAFDIMKPYANQKVCAKAVKICKKGDALVDVLNWLGEIKNDSQMEFVIKQLYSENPKVVKAAIKAVFNIDNAQGIEAVKPMFGGEYQEVIKDAMMTYEGNYVAVLNDVARGSDQQKLAVLQILEKRPMVGLNMKVKEFLNSGNQEIRDLAYKILKDVVVVADANFLSGLLENCADKYVVDVQLAIKNAMANAPEDRKDTFASTLKHVKPAIMPRFYKVFAYFGTELTVNKLIEAYESGDYKNDAKEALLLVEDEKFAGRIKEVLK